jgi:hypothetical protein
MLVATIVRDRKTGRIFIRYSDKPETRGNVDVIDTLNGSDRTELERRAKNYVENLLDEANAP